MSAERLTVVLKDSHSNLNEDILSRAWEELPPEALQYVGGSLDKALASVSFISSNLDVYIRCCTLENAIVDALVSLTGLEPGELPRVETLEEGA